MNGSTLTYGQIQSISQNLKSYSSSMEQVLGEVKSLFNNVGNESTWSGTAAASAKEEFDKLSAKFPEFSKAVNDCAAYLDQVVANYQNVDQQIMSEQH